MGSLPLPSPEDISAFKIDEAYLSQLFNSQREHLYNFVSQALTFTQALLSATGTIFFSGVGKSGFVARKISTTLISLGIYYAFLSPLDALHGDFGPISSGDFLISLSKTGSSEEVLRLAPFARDRGRVGLHRSCLGSLQTPSGTRKKVNPSVNWDLFCELMEKDKRFVKSVVVPAADSRRQTRRRGR